MNPTTSNNDARIPVRYFQMTTNRKDADHHVLSAEARTELMRRAEVQGVKPFVSLEDVMGDPEIITDFDVDDFLKQVREDRDRRSGWRSTNGDPGH
jgi:hypothetical protein